MTMANSDNVTSMLNLAQNDGTLENCVIVGEAKGDESKQVKIFTPTADRAAIVALLKRAIARLET
ncbi:hypothetical protein [Larsenimonas suaedae]|uniref:Uncharacterized protein n=1 Tax=Larsenimonas suaedae TaxID=1851019 RepID=A0ABU1H0M9_9GAMM|nr:hypothetical protein [Larsenimonas suaedae]MCM2973793.1 hypothetical protein [Larsenimonas suaedae]MDR5897317.1 hypothetical protein [Larsenimonas suaedae]